MIRLSGRTGYYFRGLRLHKLSPHSDFIESKLFFNDSDLSCGFAVAIDISGDIVTWPVIALRPDLDCIFHRVYH